MSSIEWFSRNDKIKSVEYWHNAVDALAIFTVELTDDDLHDIEKQVEWYGYKGYLNHIKITTERLVLYLNDRRLTIGSIG